MDFSSTFMGHVGFDELKKHCKQGDEFCKEVLTVLGERASLELAYSKSLKRFGQRLSKACSNLLCSPLTTAWRSIYTEMDKEAELHKKFSMSLQEECVKPTAVLVESQSKLRKALELGVESASKIMSDRFLEHTKHKKRHHQLSKENETLCDLIAGSRPKTEKDQIKLVTKQKKIEETLIRTDDDYYESLIELQRKQLEWELTSRECSSKVRGLEINKMDHLCRMAMSYSSFMSNLSQQMNQTCEIIKKSCSNLDPEGEILILMENRRGTRYQSEQLLCDYYDENFSNRIKMERRVSSLNKSLGRFLGDLQKERAHFDGMQRIKTATADRATAENISDVQQQMVKASSMITFLDMNRTKLQKAIATANGTKVDPHPLAIHIEQRFDKQGILHSTLKLPAEHSMLSGVGDEAFESNGISNMNSAPAVSRQRAQSEHYKNPSLSDDRGNSFSGRKCGTLSAKQMRGLSDGMGKLQRKQAPAPPGQNRGPEQIICKCLVKYRYDSRQPDELTIEEGDLINVQENTDADWWKGEMNGKVGIFPASYVEVVPN